MNPPPSLPTNERPTPRTDAAHAEIHREFPIHGSDCYWRRFAGDLERENAELRERLEAALDRDWCGPWDDPECREPLPWEVRKWAAVAVMELGDALSERQDTPGKMAMHLGKAQRALDDAKAALTTDPQS